MSELEFGQEETEHVNESQSVSVTLEETTDGDVNSSLSVNEQTDENITISIIQEEMIINKHITTGKGIRIIIYGKNSNDEKIYKKYQQLLSLGFYNVFIYMGGLFEWLLLQDIYGPEEFPTTCKELDVLKYKSQSLLNVHLLENGI
jgi:hypothetical protein